MGEKNKALILCICILFLAALACTAGQTPAEESDGLPAAESEAQPQDVSQGTSFSQELAPPSGSVIDPATFEYLGAFRLPGEEDRPRTFAYGGNAMTFNPNGDANGEADGFPGSLFITGHDRIAYGDLPDGSQIAEISIPQPVISDNMQDLNTGEFIQDFEDVLEGYFTGLEEIPRIGLTYLDRPETGPLLHFGWGQHMQFEDAPSHGWFNPQLGEAEVNGIWYMGGQHPYATTGYIFEIPADFAEAYTGGRYLATGRMRDGGQNSMGPTLFAYRPWLDDSSPAPNGTHLEVVTLLQYGNVYNSEGFKHALNGYQHPDEWEGGAWLSNAGGESAVLFAGTKGTGEVFWYGYMHQDGPEYVCVDEHVEDIEFMCQHADGSHCSQADLSGCCDAEAGTCASERGWWSSSFNAQMILYDPADLARVVTGEWEPWQPQPYAVLDIDEHLYLSAPEWDEAALGRGDQRLSRIGDVAYDQQNGLLYVLELYADEAKPVVHVWRVA